MAPPEGSGVGGDTLTVTADVTVRNKNGLHARPSSVVAQTSLQFESETILIRKGDLAVDAKSIMELLLLEATSGTALVIEAQGPNAEAAVASLTALFEREFDLDL